MRALHELSPNELDTLDIAEVNLECATGLPGSENLDIRAALAKLDEWAETKHVKFAYNRAGQLAAIDRYAATTATNAVASTQYAYDQHGRLTLIDHAGTAAGSTFSQDHVYSYDGANRISAYSNTIDNASIGYTYDNRGQLVAASGFDVEYAYDENGNRISTYFSIPVLEFAATIGDQNRLLEREVPNGTVDYTYDNQGNRTSMFADANDDDQWSAGEAGTEYTWDHRNRLVRVTNKTGPTGPATKTIDYTYDAFNQLVKRVEDPDGAGTSAAIDQTFYFYDQGQVALEFHKSGTGDLAPEDLAHRYLWGPAVDQLLADEQVNWDDDDADGEVLWALTDHLGSVRDVVDSNGDLRIHRDFAPFGNKVGEQHSDSSGNAVNSGQSGYVDVAFAFTGRYLDPDTGLQNNLHRWYDSTTGRWISEDPISFAAGDANLYRYVGNSGNTSIDPSGLEAQGYWAGVGEVFVGYGDAVVGTVQGGWFVIRHPIQTVQGVGTAIAHPIRTGQAIYNDAWEKSGSLRGQGELVGDVLIAVATSGAMKAVKESSTVANIINRSRRTNPQLVDDIAERAARWGERRGLQPSGPAGSLQHGYAKRLLDRYQDRYGHRGLHTEVRYLGGRPWGKGMPCKGSILLDVVEGAKDNPIRVYDYKFWNATLEQQRIQQMYGVSGIPTDVPIIVVRRTSR
jgi:RHS repeat-associated protein